jgi:fructosamine-3-kinase
MEEQQVWLMDDYYPKKLAGTLELVRDLGSGNQGGVLQYRDTRTG